MKLNHNLHFTYCTNIHRGEDWRETFHGLEQYTLAVRQRVGKPSEPFGIGLRLSAHAARELADSKALLAFRKWLDQHNCYVFTINGFPYGRFHGGRVKEQVFAPDWTTPERLDYTNLLFDLLAQIVPEGVEGSVSTLPGSFKEFVFESSSSSFSSSSSKLEAIRRNLWSCVEHIARLSERTGRTLHLGLEPEPLGLFENTPETVAFFTTLRDEHPNDARLNTHLGVNYDACHFALQYESARAAITEFRRHEIKLSKLHLSSALKVHPTPEVRDALRSFVDEVYLHQVIARSEDGTLTRFKDLPEALSTLNPQPSTINNPSPSKERGIHAASTRAAQNATEPTSTPALNSKPETRNPKLPPAPEWRIHFHIPLHSPSTPLFNNTTDHLLELLDVLAETPSLCPHLEFETYTWEVMPPELKNESVVTQLVREYEWCLKQLKNRSLASGT